jgi:hypothetical protein
LIEAVRHAFRRPSNQKSPSVVFLLEKGAIP